MIKSRQKTRAKDSTLNEVYYRALLLKAQLSYAIGAALH